MASMGLSNRFYFVIRGFNSNLQGKYKLLELNWIHMGSIFVHYSVFAIHALYSKVFHWKLTLAICPFIDIFAIQIKNALISFSFNDKQDGFDVIPCGFLTDEPNYNYGVMWMAIATRDRDGLLNKCNNLLPPSVNLPI